ncbi:MAG: hypothetical protein JO061_11495, partial [Acidobacteriaceae bacterium]|nr:hypothetical protein [Acidobacteriaceae bacterium]
ITDGMHQYSTANQFGGTPAHCNITGETCVYTATLPLELGGAFRVSALANAEASGAFGMFENVTPPGEGSAADSSITFTVLETDGTTRVPFFVTPELSTRALLLFGLAALAGLALHRRRIASVPGRCCGIGASRISIGLVLSMWKRRLTPA